MSAIDRGAISAIASEPRDFQICDLPSDQIVNWIVAQALPFDSIYFYGGDRPPTSAIAPNRNLPFWVL
jgi:hypothetical protein